MPASKKMLKSREQAKNRELGLGDEQGRLAGREKKEEKNATCTVCKSQIRMTKTNTEAKQHAESRHSDKTYEECFPECVAAAAAAAAAVTEGMAAVKIETPKPKKKDDLSFLDAALPMKKKESSNYCDYGKKNLSLRGDTSIVLTDGVLVSIMRFCIPFSSAV